MVDDGTDALYTVSSSTGVATRISATTTRFGLTSSVQPRGLAWDGSALYMITRSRLYTLDRNTGIATLVGSFGTDVSGASGLAWKRSLTETSTGETGKPAAGRLYLVDRDTDALYTIPSVGLPDLPTATSGFQTKQIGSATRFGLTDATLNAPRGIAMVNDDLYMVDRATGVAGKVGSAGLGSTIQPRGLAWDGSTMYMLTSDSLHTINRAWGTATRIGTLGAGITDAFGLAWDGEKLYM